MKTRRFGRFAIQYCTLFLLLAFCAPLLAVYPEDGMYWDPNDAGRGVYLGVQDETVFIVIYTLLLHKLRTLRRSKPITMGI